MHFEPFKFVSLNPDNPEHIEANAIDAITDFDEPVDARVAAMTCCVQAAAALDEGAEIDFEVASRFVELMAIIFRHTTDRFVVKLLLAALLGQKLGTAELARDQADVSKQAISGKLHLVLKSICADDPVLGAGIARACISTSIITYAVGEKFL